MSLGSFDAGADTKQQHQQRDHDEGIRAPQRQFDNPYGAPFDARS